MEININNPIEKIRCKIEFYSHQYECRGVTIITIHNNGKIKIEDYIKGVSKSKDTEYLSCPVKEFKKLTQEIEECISTANKLDFYIDDKSVEVKVYHKLGLLQTMERGLGNEKCDINQILFQFFRKYNIYP